MTEEDCKEKLQKLLVQINASRATSKLKFNQQVKITSHMSLSGGNGRIWINPHREGIDVSLSGQSLEKQMYGFMFRLFGRDCDGFKQKNAGKGFKRQPFWRTTDFRQVKEVAFKYAKTSPSKSSSK